MMNTPEIDQHKKVDILHLSKIKYFVFLCSQQLFFDRLYFIYTVGYAVSFSSLMVAILIIGYFRYVTLTSEPQPHTRSQLSR